MSEEQEMEAMDIEVAPTRALTEAQHPAPGVNSMLDLNSALQTAIGRGKEGVEALAIVQQMIHREQDRQAKRDFDNAFARFKELCPPIPHNRQSGQPGAAGNKFTFTWADLGQISRIADPVLGKCGLSYRFEKRSVNGRDEMFCIVSGHGHSEESSFPIILDKGSMNPIQQVISGRSYAKRVSLQDSLSLAPEHAEPGDLLEVVSPAQAQVLRDLCDERKVKPAAVAGVYGVESLENIPLFNYEAAVKKLKRAPIPEAE